MKVKLFNIRVKPEMMATFKLAAAAKEKSMAALIRAYIGRENRKYQKAIDE